MQTSMRRALDNVEARFLVAIYYDPIRHVRRARSDPIDRHGSDVGAVFADIESVPNLRADFDGYIPHEAPLNSIRHD